VGTSKEPRFLSEAITAGRPEILRRSRVVWPQPPMSAFLSEGQSYSRIDMPVAKTVTKAWSAQNVQTSTARGRG
jgi:hypothetical protein